MTRTLLCQVLLLVCVSASAQAIYKWTDENGHVHYGDRNEAPKGSTGGSVTVRGQGTSASAPAKPVASAASTPEVAKSPTTESPNLQKCLVLARAMADNKDHTPSTILAQSQELLSLCPETAYECTSYLREPERNNCQAVKFHGQMVSNRTYN